MFIEIQAHLKTQMKQVFVVVIADVVAVVILVVADSFKVIASTLFSQKTICFYSLVKMVLTPPKHLKNCHFIYYYYIYTLSTFDTFFQTLIFIVYFSGP